MNFSAWAVILVGLVGGLVGLVGIAFLAFGYDSRLNLATYECDKERQLILSPNSPGGVHWVEVYLGGWINAGSVTIKGFPDYQSRYADRAYAGDNYISAAYVGEMYDRLPLSLKPSSDARCHLRIVYRLKSDLSLVNPLW